MTRRILIILFLIAGITLQGEAKSKKKKTRSRAKVQTVVSQKEMQKVYEAARTPYKFGMVVAPQDNDHKFDCPTVFREGDSWYMTYVCYNGSNGTNGRGYETWIAKSDDLLHWQTLGRILAFGKEGWDMNQRGGFPALIDYDWGGNYNIQKYDGKYWMTYIGGEGTGYEAVNAPLSIGLASTEGDVTTAHQWETYNKPILTYNEKAAQWWEQMTQYKSTVYKVDKKKFGYQFMMYYNAGGKDATHPKGERIGVAFSNDMKKWKRYNGNPIFAHDSDGTITGDAQIVKMGNLYVMFYFSAFNPTREYNAFNTFAASYDMIHWTDWAGEDLIIPSKPYDEMFAHKSYVVKHDGIVYHFYCAVNNSGQRGIALATSKPMGKSEVNFPQPNATGKRFTASLNDGWQITYDKKTFTKDIPFNLDDYYGALQKEHGNLHGNAVFKKTFLAPAMENKEYFLRFEGVGTYAEITLNGKKLGKYDIGRTTETIDISKFVRKGAENDLVVRVSHPKGITDMPWVCGGCSSEWGFSEGSQPFGIFRPVVLEVTDKVRVEPFGVHIWNNENADSVFINTEVKNYGDTPADVSVISKLCDASGKQVLRMTDNITLAPGETRIIHHKSAISNPTLWSTEKPYLYNLNTILKRENKATDDLVTPFGIRTIRWSHTLNNGDNRFYLNGKPVYINGVCEYEHMFGQSHAFTNAQIDARIKEIRNAGFNAFRDAHQPHNLYYKELIDKEGLLWWTQFSAHIWFDTPQFKESFKRHLIKWVKERRNSPSIILWGLQNESTLPVEFAKECADLIRELDPTCGTMRLVTTCNGGDGTDWNVVQNWSGTYGGKLEEYANELKRPDQLLNGEYGAWRTLGNHTGERYTEEKQCDILERKIQLAESVKDSVCGQFLWILQSHDNPGRRQPEEGLRKVDKVGPFNHKGLLSTWEQPGDAFYMYKTHYTDPAKEQTVYIVPNITTDSIRVYSNCDSVRLTCGKWHKTVAKKENTSLFKWYGVKLEGDIIKATAFYKGKAVTADSLALPSFKSNDEAILKPAEGYNYIYNLNCGGDEYTDMFGTKWIQDNRNRSKSWGEKFSKETSPYQASQTSNRLLPVSELFRTSRFGRHELSYKFPAKPGDYRVELYFIEPWYGVGESETTDYEGVRLFDVAINDSVYLKDLDIWAQARYAKPYKRVLNVHNTGNEIKIDFPKINAGQAIISAIAIASKETQNVNIPEPEDKDMWKNFDKDILVNTPDSLLPPRSNSSITAEGTLNNGVMTWNYNVGVAKVYALRFRYYNPQSEKTLHVKITDLNGVVYKEDDITFVKTPEKKTKRRNTSITTGSQTNAGSYVVTLTGEGIDEMLFEKLTIE
ncbi:MAG: malectin domain-containing carbohydrate-binding protein [Prevotellaceae bacterium]|nr:malectin domain-containing carbohydrate-binding protein [Prevotellaceae bacterium]